MCILKDLIPHPLEDILNNIHIWKAPLHHMCIEFMGSLQTALLRNTIRWSPGASFTNMD